MHPIVFGAGARRHFLLEPGISFLNHGSFGATPRAVLEVQDEWRQRLERQPVRFMVRELPPALRLAATELAAHLGARGEDLAFVDNATTAVNAVLRSIRLAPGDEIVTTTHVYPAVLKTLGHVAERAGARVVIAEPTFPIHAEDDLISALERALSPRTRLAVIDHVTSATGLIFPAARMAALCRERGVATLIDGAHAPGMLALDIPLLGADYYAGNCHKWLFAPKGCGFLWASSAVQADLHPSVISHGYRRGFVAEFDWQGTRDPSAWLAISAALGFGEHLGGEAVRTHNHALAVWASCHLAEAWRTETLATPHLREQMIGSIASVQVPGNFAGTLEEAARLHDRLWDEHHIEVLVVPFERKLWIRVSAQVYNEPAEYEGLARAVLEIAARPV